jgi:hypothetical protein
MPMPCSDNAVLLKATAQHGRPETAVLCCGLEKNGMVGAWHRHGMASVNQTQPHCVNQMGHTKSKPLAAWHGREMASCVCELAFRRETERTRTDSAGVSVGSMSLWSRAGTAMLGCARTKWHVSGLSWRAALLRH